MKLPNYYHLVKPKVIFLARDTISTRYLYNALINSVEFVSVIFEDPVSRYTFIKNRVKRLGLLTVIGQILFQIIVIPFLKREAGKRMLQIEEEMVLDKTDIPKAKLIRVDSVNSDKVVQLLKQKSFDLILINGTRIISKKILSSTDKKFLNTHVGITPKYRGVHGGYWALVNDDMKCCGVTVHLVDKGIDTGGVLGQSIIRPSTDDNFVTYPLLQNAKGIQLLKRLIPEVSKGKIIEQKPMATESNLWSHPTLWQYLYCRLRKAVK